VNRDLGTDVQVRRAKLQGVAFFKNDGEVALLPISPDDCAVDAQR
jgi:hypothetical protein